MKQFVSFLGVGSVATAAHYAVLILLVEVFGQTPVASSVAGALVGALVGYFLNKAITFKSDLPHRKALPRFLTVAAVAMVGNYVFMRLFIEGFAVPYLAAQVITTIILIAVTYGLNKVWTFRESRLEQ